MKNPCPDCRENWEHCTSYKKCARLRAYLREIWPTAEDVERAQKLRDQELARKRRREAQKAYTDILYYDAVPWEKGETAMTDVDFEKLWEMRRDTNILREKLNRRKAAYDSTTANYSLGGGRGGTGDPVGRLAADIADIEVQIADNKQCMRNMIDDVSSKQLWRVLEAYYVEGLSWSKTAAALHYADPSGPRRLVKKFRG